MRRFECVEEGSAKFWEVDVIGSTLRVRFGRLGTEGQSKDKELSTPVAAQKEADKLIGEKTKKGYVEVGAAAPSAGSKAAPADRADLELAKQSFPELEESTYGELSFTNEPSIVDSFMADEDGERWQETFANMEWIAEEADGGAVGYWSHGGETVVVYLDNEGSFRVTGRRFVDHLSFAANGDDGSLRTFCKKHKLAPPMNEAERKALGAKVKLPDAVFAELAKAKTKKVAKPEPAAKEAKGKGSAKGAKVEKGPRPFTRSLAGCELADGRILVVTGEDFGKSYGEIITKGAVFLFDPSTSSFEKLPPASAVAEAATPAFAFSSGDGATVIAMPYDGVMVAYEWSPGKGTWSKPTKTPIRADHAVVARRLPDGRVLLFGGERATVAIGSASRWEKLPDLPEARAYDQVVPLDGQLWILGGDARGESYFGSTDRTWLFDPGKAKWSKGPALPEPVSRALAFTRADGAVVLVADDAAWVYANGKFGKKFELPELDGTSEVHVRVDDDTLISARWSDGAVIRTSLSKLTAKQVGTLALAQSSAKPFALRDGRVLFVGGTLFANNEAEPEIFSLSDGRASALPGWDADVARQAKALAKDREKRAKRGY